MQDTLQHSEFSNALNQHISAPDAVTAFTVRLHGYALEDSKQKSDQLTAQFHETKNNLIERELKDPELAQALFSEYCSNLGKIKEDDVVSNDSMQERKLNANFFDQACKDAFKHVARSMNNVVYSLVEKKNGDVNSADIKAALIKSTPA